MLHKTQVWRFVAYTCGNLKRPQRYLMFIFVDKQLNSSSVQKLACCIDATSQKTRLTDKNVSYFCCYVACKLILSRKSLKMVSCGGKSHIISFISSQSIYSNCEYWFKFKRIIKRLSPTIMKGLHPANLPEKTAPLAFQQPEQCLCSWSATFGRKFRLHDKCPDIQDPPWPGQI